MKRHACARAALATLIAAPSASAQVPTQVPAPFKVGAKATQNGDSVTLPLTHDCPKGGTLWLMAATGNGGDDLSSAVADTDLGLETGNRVAQWVTPPAMPTYSINMAWRTDLPRTLTAARRWW